MDAVSTHAGSTRRWHIRATQPAVPRETVRTPVELVYRATDRFVHENTGRWPLSVSTDKIAYIAFRCAALLDELAAGEPFDRTGAGLVAEVYPAAALQQWGLPSRGYKGNKPAHRDVREQIVSEIERQAAGRLPLDNQTRRSLEGSDDMLDAFLSAVAAYAAQQRAVMHCDRLFAARDLLRARAGGRRTGRVHLVDRLHRIVEQDPREPRFDRQVEREEECQRCCVQIAGAQH